jgi:hypothetical protein
LRLGSTDPGLGYLQIGVRFIRQGQGFFQGQGIRQGFRPGIGLFFIRGMR